MYRAGAAVVSTSTSNSIKPEEAPSMLPWVPEAFHARFPVSVKS